MNKLSLFALAAIFGPALARQVQFRMCRTRTAADGAACDVPVCNKDGVCQWSDIVIQKSGLIKSLVGDLEEDPSSMDETLVIPLYDNTGKIVSEDLANIFDYLTNPTLNVPVAGYTMFNTKDLTKWGINENDATWAATNFNTNMDGLKKAVAVANFLDTDELLKLLSAKFAALTMDKTVIENVKYLEFQMSGPLVVKMKVKKTVNAVVGGRDTTQETEVEEDVQICENGVLPYRTAMKKMDVKKFVNEYQDNCAKAASPDKTFDDLLYKVAAAVSGANDEYDTLKGFVEAHKKAVAGGAAREVAVNIDEVDTALNETEKIKTETNLIFASMLNHCSKLFKNAHKAGDKKAAEIAKDNFEKEISAMKAFVATEGTRNEKPKTNIVTQAQAPPATTPAVEVVVDGAAGGSIVIPVPAPAPVIYKLNLDLDIVNTAIEAATNIKTEMEAQFAAMTDDAMHA